ncbi:MAG TPA: hypothetical protein VFP72_05230 [Kineosporiaceae bacterium]|nr:hypothetical protein [Kineosporiaceae bacterium]
MASSAGRLLRTPVENYLHDLQQDLTGGRWEALARAVPLGKAGQRLRVRLPPPLPHARNAGDHLTVDDYLRELYEGVVGELLAAGAVERAAFVQADLLHQPVAAARLLAEHGRYALAAELLEGRTDELAVAARYWHAAGRDDLAVEMLRTRGGFAAAVDALVVTDPELAASLHGAWVDDCLARGDVAGALTAGWPVPHLRAVVLQRAMSWVPRGGGADGPALALLAGGAPETATPLDVLPPAARDRITELADRELAELARRKVVSTLQPPQFPRLVHAPGPAGPVDLRDAVVMPDGSVVAALGPQGAVLQRSDGTAVRRWDGHVDRLIVADHGSAVLLEGPGAGDARRLRRLDLDGREVVAEWQLTARPATDTFDGGLLPVVEGTALCLVDTTAARPKVVLREELSGCRVIAASRWNTQLAVLTAARSGVAGETEVWVFALPGMDLLRRQSLVLPQAAETTPGHVTLTCLGAVLAASPGTSGRRMRWYDVDGQMSNGEAPGPGWTGLAAAGPYCTVASHTGDEAVAQVLSWRNAPSTRWPSEILRASFPGAARTQVRLAAEILTVHDDTGRVLAVDLTTGEQRADHTVTR